MHDPGQGLEAVTPVFVFCPGCHTLQLQSQLYFNIGALSPVHCAFSSLERHNSVISEAKLGYSIFVGSGRR